jgi:hypothetical protein
VVGRRGRTANVIDPPGDFIRLELLLPGRLAHAAAARQNLRGIMCIVADIVLLLPALSAPAAAYGAGGGE